MTENAIIVSFCNLSALICLGAVRGATNEHSAVATKALVLARQPEQASNIRLPCIAMVCWIIPNYCSC